MNQYQQNPYGDPQDAYMDTPRKTSGMAIIALVLSVIGVIPCIGVCTVPFGILLGLIGAITIGGAKKGRGLAVAAIIVGIIGVGVQVWLGKLAYDKAYVPVLEGPNDALVAGFNGDLAGFRAATFSPASDASDEEILAFIETLRARYGNFQSSTLDQQAQPQQQPKPGDPSGFFPYIYVFDNATLGGETEITFADQVTGEFIMRPSVITISDPDLGDLTFPADAGAAAGPADADDAAPEPGDDSGDAAPADAGATSSGDEADGG